MASERSTIGKKRQSSSIVSSSIPYNEHMFKSYIHEKLYTELEGRNLIQGKKLVRGSGRILRYGARNKCTWLGCFRNTWWSCRPQNSEGILCEFQTHWGIPIGEGFMGMGMTSFIWQRCHTCLYRRPLCDILYKDESICSATSKRKLVLV